MVGTAECGVGVAGGETGSELHDGELHAGGSKTRQHCKQFETLLMLLLLKWWWCFVSLFFFLLLSKVTWPADWPECLPLTNHLRAEPAE